MEFDEKVEEKEEVATQEEPAKKPRQKKVELTVISGIWKIDGATYVKVSDGNEVRYYPHSQELVVGYKFKIFEGVFAELK